MALIIKAPNSLMAAGTLAPAIFLAGSIDQGSAVDWQADVTDRLSDLQGVTILNPRRDNWDASWKADRHDKPFIEQVTWEREGLRRATLLFFYFGPDTKSPITLYELGAAIDKRTPIIVCCPPGFWRKGNVDLECEARGIRVYEDLGEAARDAWHELHRQLNYRHALYEDRRRGRQTP